MEFRGCCKFRVGKPEAFGAVFFGAVLFWGIAFGAVVFGVVIFWAVIFDATDLRGIAFGAVSFEDGSFGARSEAKFFLAVVEEVVEEESEKESVEEVAEHPVSPHRPIARPIDIQA